AAAPSSPAGPATVLVVEDQPEVRDLAAMALEEDGYNVLQAGSGEEALGVAEKYSGRIDLMITDAIMPGMNGRELADRLTPVRPGMRVMYVSGYTADIIAREGVIEPHVNYLPKPYTSGTLTAKVREVLSKSGNLGTILVVDDEESIRMLLRQIL